MDEQRAWLKSRRRKRLRLLSTALCITLLATMHPRVLGTLSTLAVETCGGGYDTLSVTRFVDLPDEVREQTVPVGTDRSELELPDTLEAYVSVETEADTEDDAKPGEEDEDNDGGPTGEDDENNDSGPTDEGDENNDGGPTGEDDENNDSGPTGEGDENNDGGPTGEGDENNDNGLTGESDENNDGRPTGEGDENNDGGLTDESGENNDGGPTGEGDENNDGGPTGESDGNDDGETSEGGDSNGSGEGDDHEETSGGEGEDESSAEESNENAQGTDVPEESDSADNRKTAGFHVQTGFFVMPVYASENTEDAQPVETLTAAPVDSVDTTDAPVDSVDTTDAPADSVDTTDAPADGTDTNAAQENRVVIEGVTWESDPAYDKDTRGVYTFTPVLPEGCVLSEGVSLPRITVTVGSVMDAVIQELLDRIAVLPDAREYMEKEPDIDDWEEEEDAYEEAYEEWREKLYDYAEEALSIQEEIEGLTQEEQALIPQEALEKLAAWVEIAEQAAESRMVMAVAEPHYCNGITFQPWTKTDSLPKGGSYYLTENVVLSESQRTVVGSGMYLRLCLNGKSISGENRSSSIYSVIEGRMELYDCTGAGSMYCECAIAYAAISVSKMGSVEVYGGTVESGGLGSAVAIVESGTDDYSGGYITVYGGTLRGGADQGGIGVNAGITNAPVDVRGGTVEGYYGIVVRSGTLTVSGGTVTGKGHHGVVVRNNCEATISGGQISGRQAGVSAESEKNVTVSKGTVTGGEDGARVEAGNLTVSGGTITGGTGHAIRIQDTGTVTVAGDAKLNTHVYSTCQNAIAASGKGQSDLTTTYGIQYSDGNVTNGQVIVQGSTDTTHYQLISDTYGLAADGGNLVAKGKYAVTYYENDGTIANKDKYTSYTYSVGLELPTPTRTGYTFGGWYTSSGLTGTAVKSISTTATGNKTYYAKWMANTYTVTYDGNGSTGGSTADSVHTYNTAKNLTANGYEKKYTVTFNHNYAGTNNKTETAAYTFGGWNTKADGSGTAYTDKSSVKNLTATNGGTLTLYAKWSPASPVSISYTPTRTNYTFAGWYADKACSGSRVDSNGTYSPTASITLYAKWAGKEYGVRLHGNGGAGTGLTTYTYGTNTALPTGWTRSGYTFKGWYDNAQCSGEALTAIPAGAVGDKEYWAKWTDDIAPIIGNLEYSYTPKKLWQWLIGKESLRITVPVTEEGSGADVIKYTVTPDGGSPEHKTASISGGRAVITVDVDFKGTILVVCTDRAGNASAGVTVGADMSAGGVMIEDHAPRIELKTEGAEPLRTGEYETLPDISVTVTDDKDNTISSGIASVSYKIGQGVNKPVGNASDYTASMVVNKSFTIGADELSSPETVVTVTAADHAGNSSTVSKTIKIHTHSGTVVPAKAATCTEDGNLAHYGCACGKLFSDSACTTEITDHASVIFARLGHVYGGGYQYDAERHWKVCSRCKTADKKQSHNYDNDKDDQCNDCGYKRTIEKPDKDNAGEEKPMPAPMPGPEQPTAPDVTNPSEQSTTPDQAYSPKQPTAPDQAHSSKQPTTPDQAHSPKQPMTPTPVDTLRQSQVAEVQDSRPEDKQELENTGKSEPAEKTSETQTGQSSESGTEQTVPASIDNGKITISGDLVATGNVEGMTGTSTVLEAGNGAVVVKVVCAKQECTAGVADTIAVANAVLTQEHLAYVNNGGQVEIRIDVKDISDKVPAQDRETIERGIEEYQKDVPGLTHGMYLDISMFMKSGDGDWNPITETKEAVEIVIGIPKHMQGKDRTYVIIRAHDGEHTLLNDLDDAPDKITIHTERFSSYAIAYVEGEEAATGGMPKCGLCHICPTFLGICCFIWLAVIAAVILIMILVLCGKKRRQASGH